MRAASVCHQIGALAGLLVAAVGLGIVGSSLGDDSLPTPRSPERYSVLRQKCPFALASPTATPAPEKASFAANWYVTGIGRLGGQSFVSIKSRDLSTQFALYGEEENLKTGVSLVAIQWSDSVGKSTVTVRKGNETAKLEFNEAEIHGPAQSAVAPTSAAPGKPAVAAVITPPVPRTAPVSVAQAQAQRPLRIVQPPRNLPTPFPNQIQTTGPAAARRYGLSQSPAPR